MCWNTVLFAEFWGQPGLGLIFDVEVEHRFFQGIPTGWRGFERRARARQVYVSGAWARVIRNLVTQGLCSSFSLLPSATSPFYVANYESLIDCWHFLFIARLLRQYILCEYCTV